MMHNAFEYLRSQRIDSLNLTAHEYRHRDTGARHLHLASDDTNNAFVVAFLTIPRDSTGVAHILEHTALCGSRKYPVRDPFFMMTRRSLNTFMNAFTGADWTAYPFASQNRKDFDNLLQVYLDAVFFPLLNGLDFAQEGHRVEFENPTDPASSLVYKGVVYNEMKGAMSSPIARLAQTLSSEIFPTTTYHYNSGGEPCVIPDLTYQQLKDFHARHYHPSNAIFATYGNFPVEEHQAHFHDWALKNFQRQSMDLAIPEEQRYPSPRSVAASYALEGEEDTRDKTHIVLGWLLGRTTDIQALMQAHLLAGILLNHSASPLRHALETTTLGTSPSELCGLDGSNQEATFSCGLEGSNPEHAEAVEELILGVLKEVADKGVPTEMAEAVLHQMELEQREIRGGMHPYGLQLLEAAVPIALHGGDPFAALAIDPVLESLRTSIQNPEFIPGLAQRLLLDNPHRVRVTLVPDKTLSVRQAEEARDRLARHKELLGEEDKSLIVEQASALTHRQNQTDDPDRLPRVGVGDVPADIPIPEGRERQMGGLPVTWFDQGTNGLVYETIAVGLPELPSEQLDLLRLYGLCLTEVGASDKDYLAMQSWQAAVTGGVSAQCTVRSSVSDINKTHAWFWLQANGLARNQAAVSQLLHEIFRHARFDELARLRELIAQFCAAREAAVTDHGHSLAIAAACAGMGPVAGLTHQWDGLLGLQRLKTLNKAIENEGALGAFAARLAGIHERIAGMPCQILAVGEGKHEEAIHSALEQTWRNGAMAPGGKPPFRPASALGTSHQAWTVSTEVNFCARAYPAVPAEHPDAAALIVLGRFLLNGYLHRAIREQGGAYGSGASYDGDAGTFRFHSYRDPRLAETLEDFDQSLVWLRRNDHTPRQLEEAILGIIGAIDRPSSPAGEAIKAFASKLNGRGPEYVRRLRQRILQVNIEDLQHVADTYLLPERANTAVVTSARALEKNPQLDFEVHTL
jgi:Zn-dependent M16 (insulinase) family peptidase